MIDFTSVAIGLAALLYMLHLTSISLAAMRCRPVTFKTCAHNAQGITLVRPVCGIESHSELTLGSSFAQNLRHFEVIFCVAHEGDAIVPLVQRLIAAHPQVSARILFGEDRLGQNPKLNNMAKGWRAAQFDKVVFADSNLLLTPDYCARVLDGFGPNIAIVSSPPVGSLPQGFWGEVECAMLNTHAARLQYAAAALGLNFAQGKTLAFQKTPLTANLMHDLAMEPAEDAAATKFARKNSLGLGLIGPPFAQPLGQRSFHTVWNRHVRWARLRRTTFPLMFSIEIFAGICVPFLCVTFSATGTGQLQLLVALATPIIWYLPELALARFAGWHASLRSWPAMLLRDLMLPGFYISAWLRDDFVWRGHKMSGGTEAGTVAKEQLR